MNYNTIGDGAIFLEKFSEDARVKVKTTINPMGFDRTKPNKLSQNFITKQMSIVNSYKRLGVVLRFPVSPIVILSAKGINCKFCGK